jgi:uncharacterized protein (DUF849 family)
VRGCDAVDAPVAGRVGVEPNLVLAAGEDAQTCAALVSQFASMLMS